MLLAWLQKRRYASTYSGGRDPSRVLILSPGDDTVPTNPPCCYLPPPFNLFVLAKGGEKSYLGFAAQLYCN
jgi:hypothetical protein